METLILHFIFWIVNHGPLDRSNRITEAVSKTETAIQQKKYDLASQQLRFLVDSLRVTDPEARLDLAHVLFNNNDTVNARLHYQRLDSIADAAINSVALQQLGVLDGTHANTEKALEHFKQALRRNPDNEEARYNYELLKKKNQEKKEEEKKSNDSKNPEPSDYAKRLKAQAEALVKEKKYREAHSLMQEGLQKDKTVSAFNDFIKRIKTVSQIVP